MWRTALRPRWLGLLALVLVAASAMAWLGNWQWSRAHEAGDAGQQARISREPVELSSLFAAQQKFPVAASDRPVWVEGRWEAQDQVVLPGRYQDDRSGYWVLTPLRLDDGSVVGVVRGFTTSDVVAADSALTLSEEPLRVTGVMRPGEPSEPRTPGEPSALPAGQLDRIDPVDLIEIWSGPVYTGYLVADPPQGPGVEAVPLVSDRSGLALQNLSYAVQWWIFAGFGLWLWWRLVRDDHRGVLFATPQRQASGSAPGPGRMSP